MDGEVELDPSTIGVRCPVCGLQDFLPYKCSQCRRSFCHEHRLAVEGHACFLRGDEGGRRGVTQMCPLCGQPVLVRGDENPDVVINRHIDAGCPKRRRETKECQLESCRTRDAAQVMCKSCNRTFCLAHRLEADHECREKQKQATEFREAERHKEEVDSRRRAAERTVGLAPDDLRKPILVFSNRSSEAIGNSALDMERRLYLAVYFPIGSGIPAQHMFFNGRFSIGKVLDEIQERVPALPVPTQGERYYLYRVRHGTSVNRLPHMGILSQLGSQIIASGDSVIVESEDHLPHGWILALGTSSREAKKHLEKSRGRRRSGQCKVQ